MGKLLQLDEIKNRVNRNHIVMTFSDGWPVWTDPMLLFVREWMKKVRMVSGGRVQIAYLDVSCPGKEPDPAGVSIGFKNWEEMCQYIDIITATTAVPYIQKELPINTYFKWFVYGADLRGSLNAYNQILKEIPEAEEEFTKLNMKYLRGFAGIGVSIQTKNKPVQTLKDLEGLRLTGEGLDYEGVFSGIGVKEVPINRDRLEGMPINRDKLSDEEINSIEYALVHRGEADGTLALTEFLSDKSMNGADIIRYVTFLHFPQPPNNFSLMNLDLWKNLPKGIQEVFEECTTWANEEVCKIQEQATQYAIDYAKTKGCKFIEFPKSELDKFNSIVEKQSIQKAKELDAQGLPGTKILKRTRQIIE